jgi:protein-S-isoprenylcysteine O-methyltransferase Ste14
MSKEIVLSTGRSNEQMTAIKTLLWSIFAPGTITVLVPYLLLSSQQVSTRIELSQFRYLGLIPILVGAAIYVWCAWSFTFIGKGTPAPFDPPKELVVTGPYRYVRNPIYVFVILALIGEAILFGSIRLVVLAAVTGLACHLWVVFYEEPTLKRKFGESYKRYCESVSRWLPRLARRVSDTTARPS